MSGAPPGPRLRPAPRQYIAPLRSTRQRCRATRRAIERSIVMSPKAQELEGEVFQPSPEVTAQTRVKDWDQLARRALEDPEGFWAAEAEELEWYRKWEKVCDATEKPFYKWFVGGKVNIVHNCLDRHQKTWRKNKLALVWVGENGRGADLLLLRAQPRGLPLRQRPQGHGRQEGRPRHHLHAAGPGDRHRHAGLRQGRRHPLGGVRRLLASTRCRGGSRTPSRRWSSPPTAAT